MAGAASAALTITEREKTQMGQRWAVTGRILFDSSYATGGESLAPSDIGLTRIQFMAITPDTTVCGYSFGYDIANEKVLVGGVEVTLSIDPASFDIVDPNDDAGADTIAVNVPSTDGTIVIEQMDNATDLTGVKARFWAFGW